MKRGVWIVLVVILVVFTSSIGLAACPESFDWDIKDEQEILKSRK